MKKIISLLAMAIVAVQLTFAADVITKDVNQLPLPARNFTPCGDKSTNES